MPGPAFATGDRVSLHPVEEEDYAFLQRGRNHPSTRKPLTNTLIRRREHVAERVEDAEHHYLVCVDERSESTEQTNGEAVSSVDERSESTEEASGVSVSGANGGSEERSPSGETASSVADRREATEGAADLEPVGVVAFTRVSDRAPRSASLMYWVAPEHRRQGYVSEAAELFLDYAFEECGLHKVSAETLADNEASVRALESLGFVREGQFRDEEFVDGEPVDTYGYAVLADDWLA